ncbi:oxysterol-binding protein 1 isoform X2 [Anthonomus grandis grandis]|uniref:oxysterol-binding protein 1 isoform X2 n=1 Tax=Anthonomus grandis grandis TaxID=2921223 RepID=UPI002166B70E|nr:oxysterol-binding protein 1 isoform X2 [Anthonomus grandis grandis]
MGDGPPAKSGGSQMEPTMKGWLFKWTNYLKGYQRRWFVLQNGHLSYYRAENHGIAPTLSIRRRRKFKGGNQAEMAHTCRGSISLHGALIYTVDPCTFVISNGGTQTFHIKASSEVERQSWVTALELAKAKAIRTMESEEDEVEAEESGVSDEPDVLRKLESSLKELEVCGDLLGKHWKNLAKPLSEIESSPDPELLNSKSKEVCERATLFRIACNAMINSCGEYQKTAQTHGHKLIKLLQHEREQRQRLQEMVETLAEQHSKLERAANAHAHRAVSASEPEEEDENEFFDAVADGGGQNQNSDNNEHFTLDIRTRTEVRRNSSDSSSEGEETEETKQVVVVTGGKHLNNSSKSDEINSGDNTDTTVATRNQVAKAGRRKRRTRIPDKPNYPLNLWSIMKNCIGKDLSKIPMPVNFNEPLSMLQRLTEDYEYAEILDKAANCSDPCEQLAYVAAYTISSYSTTATRTGKPFNPLLGETYECDRSDDLGWKCFSEQVSHHPPIVAQYCEGSEWHCWQEFTMTSKFRGKYLQIIPLGSAQVEFLKSGNKYSWRKVTTTVHNIIVGKLWVDQHGDMEIVGKGKAKGIVCQLKYIPYSYFTRDSQRRVKGVVMNNGNVQWVISGTWDNQVEIAPVTGNTGTASNPVYQTGTPIVAWKCRPAPEDSDKFYNFTLLAAQLNEIEEGVAPTDSRLRPDQRLMEEGKWEEANKEKLRIEEKQRAVRRQREAEAEKAAAEGRPFTPYKPLWFEQKTLEGSDVITHVYKGTYWKCKEVGDWSVCPDIF